MSEAVFNTEQATTPTLGGLQCWGDWAWHGGCRLQGHSDLDLWRCLDPRGRLLAVGSYRHCHRLWQRCRLQASPPSRIAVLCHGIGRTHHSLRRLAADARRHGLTPIPVAYPSCRVGMRAIIEQLDHLLAHLPVGCEIHGIGHSYGGLLLRQCFDTARSPGWNRRLHLCSLSQIFTPNQGSQIADRWIHQRWFRHCYGPSARALTSTYARQLPIPQVPTLVCRGNRYRAGQGWPSLDEESDGTVTVSESELPGATLRTLPVGHTFGMNDQRVRAAVWQHILSP